MFCEACSVTASFPLLNPSAVTKATNPTAEMVEQTTFRGAKPNHGKTGSRTNTGSYSRPDILQKNPHNLFLLAEARCSQTALHDAIFEVNQVLCSLERADHDSLPKCMIPDFIARLSDKIIEFEQNLTEILQKQKQNVYKKFFFFWFYFCRNKSFNVNL